MSLVQAVKCQICRFEMVPNFPIGPLAVWAEENGHPPAAMLETVNQVRQQLEAELEALQRHGHSSAAVLIQHGYWCFYADQVKVYYQTLLNHPECRDTLALIERFSGTKENGSQRH
ncbi:hypothetical protein [Marinimicrobium sp. LS-A18]|uniref:hypothetical protein n=1 Tax=Marinimicrobium sp. LS-A18 TaxID=1381596 RepID=UPI0004643781|nr:hypothetical protein [Marinimicrobium sp. LS-A18]